MTTRERDSNHRRSYGNKRKRHLSQAKLWQQEKDTLITGEAMATRKRDTHQILNYGNMLKGENTFITVKL